MTYFSSCSFLSISIKRENQKK